MGRALNVLRFRIEHRWARGHASEYLDDELTERAQLRLERHLGECPQCSELLRGLRALIGSLGALREDAGGTTAGSILASVRAGLDSPPRDGV